MPRLRPSNVHVRRTVAITLVLAAWQTPRMTWAHASDAEIRNYEALMTRPVGGATVALPHDPCESRVVYGSGDTGCGSMTGGPSGGSGS